MKKFALCFALCLFCSMGLHPSFAAGNSRPFMGAGTAEDPYQISSAQELRILAERVNAGDDAYNTAHYCLTGDIDLGEENFIPIGLNLDHAFRGTFDGGEHMISELRILEKAEGCSHYGLFGVLNGGEIRNVTVAGYISGSPVSGGIVGLNHGGKVVNCMTNCRVSASHSDHVGRQVIGTAGGIVGINEAGGLVANSCYTNFYHDACVYGEGIVHTNREDSQVVNCFSSGETVQFHHEGEFENSYLRYNPESLPDNREDIVWYFSAYFTDESGKLTPVNRLIDGEVKKESILGGETTLLGALNAWVDAQESDEYRRWVQAPGRYPILEGQSLGKGEPSEWAEEAVARAEVLGFVPDKLRNQYQGEITRQEFAEVALGFLVAQYNYYDMDGMDETAFLDRFLSSEKGAKAAARTREELEGLLPPEQAAENGGSWGFLLRNAQPFSDVEGEARINGAYILGIINGKGDGTFAPEAPITRQEAAAMLERVYALYSGEGAPEEPGETMFTDREQIAPWAEAAVAFMAENRVMEGTGNGAFSPEDGYTREQCYCTFLRLYDNMPISRSKGNVERFTSLEEDFSYIKGVFHEYSIKCYENDAIILMLAHYSGLPHGDSYSTFYIFWKNGGIRAVSGRTPSISDTNDFTILQDEGETLSFVVKESSYQLNLCSGELSTIE